jgi:hypothetical protein
VSASPDDASLVQLFTTEQFVLQSVRSSTISESTSRATIFLGSVSSGLIAIALSAQATRVGTTFYALALVVLPTLVFLGLFSYARVMQTGVEDLACIVAIARIREYYTAFAPRYATVMPRFGVTSKLEAELPGLHSTRWWLLLTAGTMISAVTSVLAGGTVSISLSAAGEPLLVAALTAVPTGACMFGVLLADQRSRWRRAAASLVNAVTAMEGVQNA